MNERIEIGGRHPGYQVYVDTHPHLWVDVNDSWGNIDKHFAANSVEKIMASHVIEHMSYPEQVRAMKATLTVLKPGGELEMDTPDIQDLALRVAAGTLSVQNFQLTVFGGQDYPGNHHFFCHYPKSLYDMVARSGFHVKRVEPENGGVKIVAIKPEEGWSLRYENGTYIYTRTN